MRAAPARLFEAVANGDDAEVLSCLKFVYAPGLTGVDVEVEATAFFAGVMPGSPVAMPVATLTPVAICVCWPIFASGFFTSASSRPDIAGSALAGASSSSSARRGKNDSYAARTAAGGRFVVW